MRKTLLNVNRVTLLGNVIEDPTVRETKNGTKVANFRVATSKRWKDKSGEKKEMNTKETERESSQSQSEIDDNLSQPFVKSGVKLRNKNKFEQLSLLGLILISVLLGTAGAGKISSKDNNDIYKKDSSWPKTDTKKYEDLIIDAYNCLEDSQPSTLLSLKAPKKCEVTDGSAYSQGQLTNAQVLEPSHESRSPSQAGQSSVMSSCGVQVAALFAAAGV